MALVDLILWGILVLCIMAGLYRGAIYAFLRVVALGLAWLIAMGAYPQLAEQVQQKTKWAGYLEYYTLDNYQIDDLELWRRDVASLSVEEREAILEEAQLPQPLESLTRTNMDTLVFADKGLSTVREYFNTTMVSLILNLLCFFVAFVFWHVIGLLIVDALDHIVPFPLVKWADPLLAALGGALYGVLLLNILCAMIPVPLIVVPVAQLRELVEGSQWAMYFYEGTKVLKEIPGV